MDGDDEIPLKRPFPVGEFLGALSLILIGVIALTQMADRTAIAVKDPLTPFGLPRGLAGTLIILGLLLIPWRELLTSLRQSPRPPSHADPVGSVVERVAKAATWRAWARTYLPLSGIVVYAFAIPRIGFAVSTAALGWIMLPILGARWRVTAVLPPATAILLWLVFGKLLRVNLPTGLFF